jgi:hypothetical protein
MNEILDQKLKNQRIQIKHIVGELHGLTQGFEGTHQRTFYVRHCG